MARRRRKKKRRRRFKRLLLLAVLVAALGGTALGALWLSLPDVGHLAMENPAETALMRERGGEPVQHWVPLGRISERLRQAVVVAEDASFFHHEGFDFHEIREAFERNLEEGRVVRGASTITQQLAKNLFLSTDRTVARKLKEATLTHRLEESLTKERILEIYLNVIEWGPDVYGAEAAAQRLFGKPASGLDAAEASLMAAMIPNPIRLDPCERPEAPRARQERILGWMRAAGRSSDAEYEQALARTPRLRCR